MKKAFWTFVASVCTTLVAQTTETSISLVPYANQRIWQMCFDAAKPLQWHWDEAAVKATVTVADLVSGTIAAPAEVTRTSDSISGSFTVPMPTIAESGEALIDVTLEQRNSGDVVLSSQTARLAYLPSSITVDKAGPRFGTLSRPRPVAYDNAWTDAAAATGAAYAFVPATDPRVDRDLGTPSGWFVQPVKRGALTVSFPGTPGVLQADVLPKPGFILNFR